MSTPPPPPEFAVAQQLEALAQETGPGILTGARMGAVFGVVAFASFSLADRFLVHDLVPLLVARLTIIAALLLYIAFTYAVDPRRRAGELAFATCFIIATGVNVVTVMTGGAMSRYHEALLLTIFTHQMLAPWPPRASMLAYIASVITYDVLLIGTRQTEPLSTWVTNNAVLWSAAALASAVGFRSQGLRLQEFLGRRRLSDAHSRLQQLDRFKSQFFANITHELKTPLMLILTPLEILMESADERQFSEADRTTLRSMHRSGMKLLRMVGDLLDLTKLEESRLRLRIEDVDLVAFLDGLVAQVRPLAERKNVELAFMSDARAASVAVDVERIERVFVNLLSNATKFTPAGGKIRVELADSPTSVTVRVRDTGQGFPPEMRERVFERFFQVDGSGTRKHGGTGIGLALARELVELHGGRISAESDGVSGSTFTVELRKGREHLQPDVLERRKRSVDMPAGSRETDRSVVEWTGEVQNRTEFRFLDIDEATEQRAVARPLDEGSRRYTALVVDDTPDILRLVGMTIQSHFRVMTARDGREGVEMALAQRPDVVITDLMMPELDGIGLLRELRADPRTATVPILMLTARGDVEDRVSGLTAGANAYMAKPFNVRELRTTVLGLVGHQERNVETMLTGQLDSLGTMAGGLAHEINNPLNYIKGAVAMLADDSVALRKLVDKAQDGGLADTDRARLDKIGDRMRKMTETAEAGVKRIAGTVDVMRRYSREGFTRTHREHDLHEAIRDVAAVVVPATRSEVALELDLQASPVLECVPDEMHQVLSNLIQNAIEAAPTPGGAVRVWTRDDGAELLLGVRDNGAGVKPELRTQIFTPFFSTKGPGKGMGVGLTIVRRVVSDHHGSISVCEAPGGGCEMVVRLPRKQKPVADAVQ